MVEALNLRSAEGDQHAHPPTSEPVGASPRGDPRSVRVESFEQELLDQSRLLQKGVYGLPEAVTNIQSLKAKIAVLHEDRVGKLLNGAQVLKDHHI
ncbi:hypothetical protein ABBQ38_007996 [Trebouxia sp. C0009 RCD-2024]